MNRPREDWPRLASYVISARIAAGYKDRQEFSAATGVTARTLGKLETGHPVSPETLAVVEQHVHWKPDSARSVLWGGEPAPAKPEDGRGGGQLDDAAYLDALTDEERRTARAFIETIRRSRAAQDESRRANGA